MFLFQKDVDSKHNARLVQEIASSVISCRFEATDPESDEVVLNRIVQVSLKIQIKR